MLNSFYDKFIFTNTLRFTHDNFYLVDIPFFISPVDSLSGIIAVQDIDFQKKIYSAVKKSTIESLSKEFLKNFGGLDKGKELKLFEDFFSASGWGKLEGIDLQLESKRAIIVLSNSPFVASLKGKTKFPADVFLRGTLAGLFSALFSDDIDCVEVECAALAGERCKFVLKPKAEFDFSNVLVQQQLLQE